MGQERKLNTLQETKQSKRDQQQQQKQKKKAESYIRMGNKT